MRKNNTLSLYGYFFGGTVKASIGVVSGRSNDDDTCRPSIGVVNQPSLRPKIVSHIRQTLSKTNLPPPSSRDTRKTPDLKSDNPTFAAMLIKHVNERFGGDAPKVYAAAKISRKTYSAIVGNELRPVSKQTAIQLALALKLSRTEADALLKAAGFAFSPAILEDIIVCACMASGIYEIDDVNGLLSEYGAKTFPTQTDFAKCLPSEDI